MIKKSTSSKLFDICNITFFIICGILTLFPVWNVLMTSLVSQGEFNARALILFPHHITFDSYKYLLFFSKDVTNAFMVTVAVTVVGSIYSVLLTVALGYGLSRRNLPGRNFFLTFIIITMFFSGGLIPFYLLVQQLHLTNSFLSLFLMSGVNVYYFVIVKSFFTQFPVELEEAANIDGANDITIFFKIVLPLSKPVIATFLLFYAVGYWNSWYNCLLFIQDKKLYTLQYVLRGMVIQTTQSSISSAMQSSARESHVVLFEHGLRMATVMIATIPIVCVYPFLQKYFEKGVMIGSVKG